jgi:hypothetical protein
MMLKIRRMFLRMGFPSVVFYFLSETFDKLSESFCYC